MNPATIGYVGDARIIGDRDGRARLVEDVMLFDAWLLDPDYQRRDPLYEWDNAQKRWRPVEDVGAAL